MKLHVLLLLALPFLPLVDLVEVFLGLRGVIRRELEELWKYIDQTYVRGVAARGRRRAVPPLLPPALWNVYDATRSGYHRTNNYVEAWHSTFNKYLNTYHSNLWKFLEKLKKQQHENTQQFVQIRFGHRNIRHPVNRTYLNQQRIVENIVATYADYKANDDLLTYLRAISYRLKRPGLIDH